MLSSIINFQSIKNKKAELLNFINEHSPAIIMGTETWLNSSIHTSEIFPVNYNVVRRDRPDGYGGVLIAVRSDYIYDELIMEHKDVEMAYIRIKMDKHALTAGVAYRPPNSSREYMDNLCSNIRNICHRYSGDTMWLGGDFNLPDINWTTGLIEGSQNPIIINSNFLDCIRDAGLEQSVTQPTRNNVTLDLFLTNRPSLIEECIISPGLGDHEIVNISSTVSAKRRKPIRRKIHLWKRAEEDKMRQMAHNFQESFLNKFDLHSNIEAMWTDIKHNLLDILEKCVPSKYTSSRFNQAWINGDVKRKTRQKKRSYAKAMQTGDIRDRERYQRIKQESRAVCKQAYNDYINNMISADGSNKKFWSYVKNLRKDNSGVAPLEDRNGQIQPEPKVKANILNDQFSSVFNAEEDHNSIPNKGPSPFPTMPSITVGRNGLLKLLQGLKIHKATGPDEVSCRLLKHIAIQICDVYQLFFQSSIQQGKIPAEWKEANVVPIYKKGDKKRAENYRPVSLTSISCKLLEHILCSNILRHLDNHSILTESQHGFRKNRSCESQLITTIDDLAKSMDDSTQTDVILLDFAKAFDKVPHGRLLYKLKYYGIREHHHAWIADFLHDRTQQVVLDSSTSNKAPVQSGVPQGSVLGPLLFLLFINDLPECVSEGTEVRLFADDCALYRKINSQADCQILQDDLDKLQQWETDWMMAFHPSKCQVINVTRKKKKEVFPYSIHGHILAVEKVVKYLGVNIHEKLSWNDHIGQVTKKAQNTLNFLQRNTAKCPQETKIRCYTTVVRPLVEYCGVVWDPYTQTNIQELEKVQRRAARYVFSDYRRTVSVTEMLQQLQWRSLQERRAQAKATMMFRILNNLVALRTPQIMTSMTSTRGNTHKLHIPHSRTLTYQKSFYPILSESGTA
jgi:hypothetical protein